MAVELQLEEHQLPAELLDDLFFVDKAGKEDRDDHLAGLARQMARYDDVGVVEVGEDWDLFDDAAGQSRWWLHERRFRYQPRKQCPSKSTAPFLSHQQLQAARLRLILHLKRQQALQQQQLYAAWERPRRARRAASYESGRCSRSFVLPSSGWSPLQLPQQQQPNPCSEMRAAFLRNSGARKESIGTGVFLPRTPASKDEYTKRPECSAVLVPTRVAQALNLNLEKLGVQRKPSPPHQFVLQHGKFSSSSHSAKYDLISVYAPDAFVGRRNFLKSRNYPPPVAIRAPVGSLPQEWTY